MTALVVAHRGSSAQAPENTMAAFKLAAQQGADMIELDVQKSGDGVLIVYHDDHLERCTNIKEIFPKRLTMALHEFDFKELRKLDASRNHGRVEASEDTRIPSLEEVLTWLVRTPNLVINIELKSLPRFPPRLAEDCVKLVKHFGLESRIIFSSFHHNDLLRVKKCDSNLRTAVLCADAMVDLPRYAKEVIGADAINPGAHLLGLKAYDEEGKSHNELIEDARRMGLETFVWTLNDEAAIRAVAELGVTGIITDDPARARLIIEGQPQNDPSGPLT
jgi:glycerophosphoryl diester phosphodiesterase